MQDLVARAEQISAKEFVSVFFIIPAAIWYIRLGARHWMLFKAMCNAPAPSKIIEL